MNKEDIYFCFLVCNMKVKMYKELYYFVYIFKYEQMGMEEKYYFVIYNKMIQKKNIISLFF